MSNNHEPMPSSLVEQHNKIFEDMYYGNGKPGMTTRVNELEKAMESFRYYFRWIILLLGGLAIHAIWDVLVKK